MKGKFLAHIRKEAVNGEEEQIQYVEEHCRNATKYAKNALEGTFIFFR